MCFRLSRERERLPEHHQNLLNEQINRNKELEGILIDREIALKSDENRRLGIMEQRMKEANEEISRHRNRIEAELMDER